MEEAKPPDDLLQIALQHQDVEVVRTLLAFTAGPANIVMDELFKEEFNAVRPRPRPRPTRRSNTPCLVGLEADWAVQLPQTHLGRQDWACSCLKHTLGGILAM